jgi:hypothetical protein
MLFKTQLIGKNQKQVQFYDVIQKISDILIVLFGVEDLSISEKHCQRGWCIFSNNQRTLIK